LIRSETSSNFSARSLRLCLALACCLVAALGMPIAAAEASEREQVRTYLELARLDLTTIDVILADTELDLLEQEAGDDEELTELQIEHYRQLLAAIGPHWRGDFQNWMVVRYLIFLICDCIATRSKPCSRPRTACWPSTSRSSVTRRPCCK
jgi:hypothetical protein